MPHKISYFTQRSYSIKRSRLQRCGSCDNSGKQIRFVVKQNQRALTAPYGSPTSSHRVRHRISDGYGAAFGRRANSNN